MIFIILLIYFIILIIIELSSIIFSKQHKKSVFTILKENSKNQDLFLNTSKEDIDIKNYIGKFKVIKQYGFFINLNKWYILEPDKLYKFNYPVNVKILKIKYNEDIKYYSEK